MPQTETRINKLERALEEFITSVGIEFNKLYNSQMRTEAELSTKSTLDASDIKDFGMEDILVFRDFFPEYREKKLIGILATLRVEENVLKNAERTKAWRPFRLRRGKA